MGVVDLASRKLVRVLQTGQDPESFDLSPDGKTLYVSNEETAEMTVLDGQTDASPVQYGYIKPNPLPGQAEVEPVDELTYRIRFDRSKIVTADLIRRILAAVEVRDLLIEDEPIEEVIKRIYAGEALTEVGA